MVSSSLSLSTMSTTSPFVKVLGLLVLLGMMLSLNGLIQPRYQDDDVQQDSNAVRSRNMMKLPSQQAAVLNKLQEPTSDDVVVVNLPTVFDGVQARAFDSWNETTLPCFKPEKDWTARQASKATRGFVFVKGYKTGSSSTSGMNLRMARNVALRSNSTDYPICRARSDHAWAHKNYFNRIPSKTWLWSVLREPTDRAVSQFFHFAISRQKFEPSDEGFVNYLRNGPTEMIHDYYLRALWLGGEFNSGKAGKAADICNAILDEYNFLGITERMDESAVALAMLLGLPLTDVLYLSVKTSGGFDDAGGLGGGSCNYIWPSFISEGMNTYLNSKEWKGIAYWDTILYQAANRSLDLTIDRLGREKFQRNLIKYQQARRASQEECMEKTVFPCSEGGHYTPDEYTHCLWKDSGCGMDCLDQVGKAHQL